MALSSLPIHALGHHAFPLLLLPTPPTHTHTTPHSHHTHTTHPHFPTHYTHTRLFNNFPPNCTFLPPSSIPLVFVTWEGGGLEVSRAGRETVCSLHTHGRHCTFSCQLPPPSPTSRLHTHNTHPTLFYLPPPSLPPFTHTHPLHTPLAHTCPLLPASHTRAWALLYSGIISSPVQAAGPLRVSYLSDLCFSCSSGMYSSKPSLSSSALSYPFYFPSSLGQYEQDEKSPKTTCLLLLYKTWDNFHSSSL